MLKLPQPPAVVSTWDAKICAPVVFPAPCQVRPPATTGVSEDFDRIFRVQANTIEQVVMFLPALWVFSLFVSPQIATAAGAIWIVGRVMYATGYYAKAASRGSGFGIASLASNFLIAGARPAGADLSSLVGSRRRALRWRRSYQPDDVYMHRDDVHCRRYLRRDQEHHWAVSVIRLNSSVKIPAVVAAR